MSVLSSLTKELTIQGLIITKNPNLEELSCTERARRVRNRARRTRVRQLSCRKTTGG